MNSGRFAYGTAFAGDRIDDIAQDLANHGFSYQGKDVLTSGITGEKLQSYIFMVG